MQLPDQHLMKIFGAHPQGQSPAVRDLPQVQLEEPGNVAQGTSNKEEGIRMKKSIESNDDEEGYQGRSDRNEGRMLVTRLC